MKKVNAYPKTTFFLCPRRDSETSIKYDKRSLTASAVHQVRPMLHMGYTTFFIVFYYSL